MWFINKSQKIQFRFYQIIIVEILEMCFSLCSENTNNWMEKIILSKSYRQCFLPKFLTFSTIYFLMGWFFVRANLVNFGISRCYFRLRCEICVPMAVPRGLEVKMSPFWRTLHRNATKNVLLYENMKRPKFWMHVCMKCWKACVFHAFV